MISTAQNLKSYKKDLRKALKNQFLGSTLDNFASAYKASRAMVFEGIDLDEIIKEISQVKDEALSHLENLFEAFKANAETAGAKVHRANTATEANEIIASIARENHVMKIVKGKSMTTKETFLNDFLEKEGFEVTETDLGEWIIQLRHEGPSHMVLPAIHLSRQEIADLFYTVTREHRDPDDIEGLVKVARKKLRQAFLEADMGITGANFAIAETGTIGLVTNEGNGRLVTTLPPVHVALVGFDKLLPDLESALRVLQVLPRNATGQTISSYVTWITGATECGSARQGHKEMHIVFLDNGRLALSKDPIFSQILRCIRCGACANVCPIYQLVGGHNYGHVYVGAIGLILTYFYHGYKNARAIIQDCLNCQACKAICPAAIDLPHLIKETYRLILNKENRKPAKNLILSLMLKNRRLFHFILRRAHLAQKPLAKGQPLIRHLPFLFGKEHEFRSLPVIAAAPLRVIWKHINPKIKNPRYCIALFGGCLVDFVYPEQAKALLSLLKDHQVQLEYPMDQTCCGLPVKMMGENETAKEVAIQNLKAMDPANYDYVLTLCASCGSHIKNNYPKLLHNISGLGINLNQLADKLIDFSSFMMDVLHIKPEIFKEEGKSVAYHSPCHLCRGLGVTQAPRELLRRVGFEYIPSKNEDACCGLGGYYSVEFPEVSAEILRRKLDHVETTGAGLLVTDCPGCVLQLRGGFDKRDSKIEVRHIVEAVANRQKRPVLPQESRTT